MALKRTGTNPRIQPLPTKPASAATGKSIEARARALITHASADHGSLFYAAIDDGDEQALAPILARAAKGDADLYATAMVQLFGGTKADHLPPPAAKPASKK